MDRKQSFVAVCVSLALVGCEHARPTADLDPVSIAQQAIRTRFPREDISDLKPKVYDEKSIWYVQLVLDREDVIGGGMTVIISKKTGKVLKAWLDQ